MTFQELLIDSLKFEEWKLAYSTYWLIKKGVYNSSDLAINVNWDLVNHEEVKQMWEHNELNINPIKLFSMLIEEKKYFIVFAIDEKSAKGHFLNEIGTIPIRVIDITDKLDKSFWFPDKGKHQTLRELKNEKLTFPATAMIYEKE